MTFQKEPNIVVIATDSKITEDSLLLVKSHEMAHMSSS